MPALIPQPCLGFWPGGGRFESSVCWCVLSVYVCMVVLSRYSSCLTSPQAPPQGLWASGLAELVPLNAIRLLPVNLVLTPTNPSVFFILPYSSALSLLASQSQVSGVLVGGVGALRRAFGVIPGL